MAVEFATRTIPSSSPARALINSASPSKVKGIEPILFLISKRRPSVRNVVASLETEENFGRGGNRLLGGTLLPTTAHLEPEEPVLEVEVDSDHQQQCHDVHGRHRGGKDDKDPNVQVVVRTDQWQWLVVIRHAEAHLTLSNQKRN